MNTIKSKKNDKVVAVFSPRKLTGTYFVAENCDCYKLCKDFSFTGFSSIPKGFSRDGYGFASPAGTYLTSALADIFGENITFEVSKNAPSHARRTRKNYKVILNHGDYLRILDPLRDIRHERNIKSTAHVSHVLGLIYPKNFNKTEAVPTVNTYEEDKFSKIAQSSQDIHKKLSKADVETIARLYALLVEDNKADFSTISVAEESKKQNERIYLQSVIDEFARRLTNKTLSESDWQRFLQRYVLLFNTSYVNAIEKLSIDLRGKYPDFMLVNVYGYIDIYEIKKPFTSLLKHDDSRDNYYWDTEIAKAITQTEKYVQMLSKKEHDVKEIIKEKYGIDVKVVRPRGYIVAGSTSQFTNSKMEDDFRLLASALKNVDIILYDDLLGNLRNLLARLKKNKRTTGTQNAKTQKKRKYRKKK